MASLPHIVASCVVSGIHALLLKGPEMRRLVITLQCGIRAGKAPRRGSFQQFSEVRARRTMGGAALYPSLDSPRASSEFFSRDGKRGTSVEKKGLVMLWLFQGRRSLTT